MPPARDGFSTAGPRPPLSTVTGRVLTGPAINRSQHAWASTVYNADGLIVSAPNPQARAALRNALVEIFQSFHCRPEARPWLPDPAENSDLATTVAAPVADEEQAGVLAVGVKIVPIDGSGQRPTTPPPDPWPIVEAVRSRLGGDGGSSVGLNHLLSVAEQVGGNPLAIGHGRVGLDGYGSASWGGHGPVALMLQPRPVVAGRRPRVVLLDTGIGDHPWFRDDPAETTVCFDDGSVVGPDIAQGPRAAAAAVTAAAAATRTNGGMGGDTAGVDPLRGTLPTHTGHGTFIAGLLRQACPAADIVALTVMDETGFVPEHQLIRALDVLRTRQREKPGWADAIVLSLGYYAETGDDVHYTSGLKEILLDLGRLGVVVFAAAGNDATRRPSYPAAFAIDPAFDDPEVLPVVSVAALNPDGTVAPFSNDGPWVTAEALGVNLVSAAPVLPDGGAEPRSSARGSGGRPRSTFDPDDYRSGYAVWSGTSFAAPVLAGEYLRRLQAADFPPGNCERRALLPVGRQTRAASGAAVSPPPISA
jgi:hypothetical protein